METMETTQQIDEATTRELADKIRKTIRRWALRGMAFWASCILLYYMPPPATFLVLSLALFYFLVRTNRGVATIKAITNLYIKSLNEKGPAEERGERIAAKRAANEAIVQRQLTTIELTLIVASILGFCTGIVLTMAVWDTILTLISYF